MIITCKQCHTRFRVDGSLIKETGTRVRCSNCQHVFTVFLPPPEAEKEAVSTIPLPKPASASPGAASGAAPGASLGAAPGNSGNPSASQDSPVAPGRQFSAKPIIPAGTADIYVPPELQSPTGTTPARTFMLNTRAADNGSAQMPNGSGSSGEFVQKGQGESPEDASLIYSDDNPDPSAQYGATPPYTPPPTSLDKDLGLSADPTMDSPPRVESPPVKDEDSGVYGVFDPLNRSQSEVVVPKDPIVPRKSGPSKKKLIILAAAIIIALCVVGTLFLNLKPASDQKAALQSQSASLEDGADEARGPLDNQPPNPNTTEKLNFKEDETSHFIRTNLTSGKLLIITGRITNDFPDRRSFIRVRGILKNPDGVIEAERQSYAGNYLSETELTSLPINEILSRLAIKGGQNGLNMNLDPGASISFMLVFDKIPVDLVNYEYVVDVVSSTSAGPPVASTPPQNEPAT